MSEIELKVNVDSCNNEGIKTIKGNNNAEIYKLYILKNKRRLSLVGKTVKLGYVMAGTSKGDIIENLNITNAEQGEITFPITNRISKKDGVYSCQLAIYGADEFLEYTATFGLTVEDNIFTKIAGEIKNSKDLTYIERILEEAKTVSGDLKTNIPVATNLNSSLESNISNARNINTTLADTAEKSKVAATDAIEKKSQLEKSITKAKEFIDGLDGSQNIPQLRLDVTELQNGLKSNQALAYAGSSINAENTLEGRTEGMTIGGRTLVNLSRFKSNKWNIYTDKTFATKNIDNSMIKPSTVYTFKIFGLTNKFKDFVVYASDELFEQRRIKNNSVLTSKSIIPTNTYVHVYAKEGNELTETDLENIKIILVEGDFTNIKLEYFEGLKSFGEAEQEGDKYKISILSKNKNFFNKETDLSNWWVSNKTLFKGDSTGKKYSIIMDIIPGYTYTKNFTTHYNICSFLDENDNVLTYNTNSNISPVAPKNAKKLLWYLDPGGIDKELYNKIQVEIGTLSTEYQPYKEDKKDILISAPLPGFDFGEDIMYEENGQVKITRNIDTYTFTGDETMRDTTEQDEKSGTGKYKVFALTVNKTIDINKNINNNFPKEQFNVAFQNMDSEGLAVTQYGVYIKILKSKLSTQDTDGFKAWLKANQTVIYFVRATPVTEIVENCVDIDLDTYQEKTYFNILNSLPGTLDFKVPSNIGSVVQNMAKEVNNIWDVINNLLVPSIVKANGNLAMLKLNNNLN